ncbi:MAG: biotin/lipoyl-binding protein [Bacteroidetes bacterium]|nr:MAG: biotin/lipoyl-binding protein [Bacteroidota bacterium]
MNKNATFRATVGDRSFQVEFRDGQVYLDGEAVEVSFEPVDAGTYSLLIDGRSVPVYVEGWDGEDWQGLVGGRRRTVRVQDARALLLERFGFEDPKAAAAREVRAPMPGLVLKVLVEEGQTVQPGDGLVILEAMKMENELRAPGAAVVRRVHVAAGEAVLKNDLLVEFA